MSAAENSPHFPLPCHPKLARYRSDFVKLSHFCSLKVWCKWLKPNLLSFTFICSKSDSYNSPNLGQKLKVNHYFYPLLFQNRTNSQEMPLIHTSIDDQQRSTSNSNNRNQILLEPMNKIVVEQRRRQSSAFTRSDAIGGRRRQMSSLAIAFLALLSSSIAIEQSDAAGKQHELILFKSEFFPFKMSKKCKFSIIFSCK